MHVNTDLQGAAIELLNSIWVVPYVLTQTASFFLFKWNSSQSYELLSWNGPVVNTAQAKPQAFYGFFEF